MDCMKKLIIKIGADSDKDLREAWSKPSKELNGTTIVYLKNAILAHQILSEERLDLMKHIMTYSSPACVSDLVESTGRKQEAISRDISILESQGMIQKNKKGRKVFIEPKIDSIEIRFK
ncbi:MAG: ArsR family transcriptional regulator [Candidatus ainarchaeum sp.]|nr:ArsR family transcriptional regulator [Candidatus ainarchaeum sp.]